MTNNIPDPLSQVIMTQEDRTFMEKYIKANAHGIILQQKLRDAYRTAWKAREIEIAILRKQLEDAGKKNEA